MPKSEKLLSQFVLRAYDPRDRNYLIKTCIATLKKTVLYRAIGPERFEDLVRLYMLPLIDEGTGLVANLKGEDPSFIVGFCLAETCVVGLTDEGEARRETILHFVHTHRDFQRMGLATRMLGDIATQEGVVYTHRLVDGFALPDTWRHSYLPVLKRLGVKLPPVYKPTEADFVTQA